MPGKTVFGAAPDRPLSHAVRAGDFVYVSGQVPTDASGRIVTGGLEAQVNQVLDNIKAALALAGATMEQVVKTTCILEDARDFPAFNKAYAAYFRTEPPARTTIEARLMANIMVEIDAIAVRDTPQAVQAFLARNGDPYARIGDDKASQAQLAIGSSGVPETFVIGSDGRIAYQHVGDLRDDDVAMLLRELEKAR